MSQAAVEDALHELDKAVLAGRDAEIARLTDAIWEYGQHRPSCRIGDGKECDCGFFDIIKSLKD